MQRWGQMGRRVLRVLAMALLVGLLTPVLSVRVGAAGTTFTVDTAGDATSGTSCAAGHAAGTCTLRQALTDANAANPGAGNHHTVNFNIPTTDPGYNGTTGVFTIAPTLPFPPATLTVPVAINGYSQPGASANTLAVGDNAVLKIELSGANAQYAYAALQFGSGSAGSSVRGLAINRWTGYLGASAYGVVVQSVSDVTIAGNFIGLDPAGAAFGNENIALLLAATTNVTVGGTTPADRNVISGNNICAISISGSTATAMYPSANNTVQGNYLGVGPDGVTPRPNSKGVQIIDGSRDNLVGGTAAGAGNVISGNSDLGVFISADTESNPPAPNPTGNVIAGNYIGTNAAGTAAVSNASTNASNIQIQAGSANTIGGTAPGAGNVISGAVRHGVVLVTTNAFENVVQGNRIGTNAAGTAALGNVINGVYILQGASGNTIGGTATGAGNVIAHSGGRGVVITDDATRRNAILGNRIFANTNIGIDLNNDGVTANHVPQAFNATGPNSYQNYPVLTGVSATTASGTLTSVPTRTFRIEFFANPTNTRQGQTFLGSTSVTTDGGGIATFMASVAGLVSGQFITATATDTDTNPLFIDTSEFAAPMIVPGAGPMPTITGASPGSGDVRGGSPVIITGTNFVPEQTSLTVDGATVTPTQVTTTQITFVAPAHAAGSVSIAVTVNGTVVTRLNAYTYGVVQPQPMPKGAQPTVGMPQIIPTVRIVPPTASAGTPTPRPAPPRR